jgi:ketosteroid isomerase-like protein
MNLPKVITNLIDAQNSHDGVAYAACFSDTAVVFDEGQTHKGKVEIQHWIEKSNQENQTMLKPVSFEEGENDAVLKGEISGTFPGSPAILNFHFVFQEELIKSLKITG